jgi:hypothetical protein
MAYTRVYPQNSPEKKIIRANVCQLRTCSEKTALFQRVHHFVVYTLLYALPIYWMHIYIYTYTVERFGFVLDTHREREREHSK